MKNEGKTREEVGESNVVKVGTVPLSFTVVFFLCKACLPISSFNSLD